MSDQTTPAETTPEPANNGSVAHRAFLILFAAFVDIFFSIAMLLTWHVEGRPWYFAATLVGLHLVGLGVLLYVVRKKISS